MNFFSYSPQIQRILEALGMTIFHSFWQGLLLMLLLSSLLKWISYEKPQIRFLLSFTTLILLLISFVATFYYQWDSLKPLAPLAQQFSTEPIALPNVTNSEVERTLWDQMQGKAYEILFQLSKSAHWMAIFWLAGSFFFSARLGLGLWQVRQLKQYRQTFPQVWQQKVLSIQQQLCIRQNVTYGCSEQLKSPLTLGWLKPIILMPASMLMAMPADQLESILVHELAHIRRHDYLWNLLQSLSEVVLFYHPAYWYIASVLEQERELACDAITLQVTGKPQVYAQALLQVASLQASLSSLALSVKGRSGFAERIKRIVAPNNKKKSVQPLPFLLSFCLIGFLLFAFTQKSPVVESVEKGALEQKSELKEADTTFYTPFLRSINKDSLFKNRAQNKPFTPPADYQAPSPLEINENLQKSKIIELETSPASEKKIARGRVVDARTNEPLAGVAVYAKIQGAKIEGIRTLTDSKGEYEFTVPNDIKVLVHSKRGYSNTVIPTRYLSGSSSSAFDGFIEMKRLPQDHGKEKAKEDKLLKGEVIDEETGQPIAGVNVLISGTTSGTVTNREGRFQLQLTENAKNISFSMIGYEKKELSINNISQVKLRSLAPNTASDNYKESDHLFRIMGKVTDRKTGESLPGVAIFKGRKYLGSVTHPTGIFTVPVQNYDDTLTFRFDGYQAITVPLKGRKKIDIALDKSLAPSTSEDSILFIIDEVVREDIQSFEELDLLLEKEDNEALSMSISKGQLVYLGKQEKQYQTVVKISTYKTSKEVKSIVRGKIIDQQTGKPLSGVEVTSLTEENIKTFTDEHGEYELRITEETMDLNHALAGYIPFILPRSAVATFERPIIMPLKKFDDVKENDFESNLRVFPNPGNDEIKVGFHLQEAASVEFEMLDKGGRFLHSFEYHFPSAGAQEITIPTDGFPADTYLLRVKLNGKFEILRFILK